MSYSDYNNSYSNYNNTAVGGGGFLSSQSNGVDMSQTSPANGTSNRNTTNSGGQGNSGGKQYVQSLVPSTIKQISECTYRDSKFYIDNREVLQVSFVALVVSFEVQQTNISYWLSDGTGDMNCRLYIESNMDGGSAAGDKNGNSVNEIKEHTYVRVIGKLQSKNDQVNVIAVQISPIIDHNQITFHMLDALATHLKNTKGAPNQQQQQQQQPGGTKLELHNQTNNMSQRTNYGNSNSSSSSSSSSVNIHHNSSSLGPTTGGGFSLLQTQVLSIFQGNPSDQGASLSEVSMKLPGVTPTDIRAAVDFLSEEGHLYSTIDEDHYKCTMAQ